ncbi:MAG: hypothetical protein ACRD9R_14840 [Pyrinomonadaceae bacterium]
MSVTLDKIIAEVKALPPDERRRLRELLDDEAQVETERVRRAVLSRAIRGKYAHLATSSETFATLKRQETEREDAKLGRRS